MTLKLRLHLIIHGNVQGVFYRVSAREKAQQLGLLGWIRNTDTGDVEAVLEGTKRSLESFLSWCYDGPDLSQVSKIDHTWSEFKGEYSELTILQN